MYHRLQHATYDLRNSIRCCVAEREKKRRRIEKVKRVTHSLNTHAPPQPPITHPILLTPLARPVPAARWVQPKISPPFPTVHRIAPNALQVYRNPSFFCTAPSLCPLLIIVTQSNFHSPNTISPPIHIGFKRLYLSSALFSLLFVHYNLSHPNSPSPYKKFP